MYSTWIEILAISLERQTLTFTNLQQTKHWPRPACGRMQHNRYKCSFFVCKGVFELRVQIRKEFHFAGIDSSDIWFHASQRKPIWTKRKENICTDFRSNLSIAYIIMFNVQCSMLNVPCSCSRIEESTYSFLFSLFSPPLCLHFACRFFRVIPAEQYLAEFSSDRRHMRRPDGTWIKPPPPYAPIQSNGNNWISQMGR